VADLLDTVRREIDGRRRELRPLVDEHERLRAALRALGSNHGVRAARAGTRRTTAARRGAGARAQTPQAAPPNGRKRRASRGARAEQVLAAVKAKPGVGVSELARTIGVSRPYLYALLPRLAEQDGGLVKRGTGWHPAQPS
jgi:hypothetical protein